MEEKEKYHAEIDAKLIKFGETLNEIKTKAEQRKKNLSEISVDDTLRKHKNAKAKLEQLKQSDEDTWQNDKMHLDAQVNDISEDLRKALAYFGQ
jgi:heterodisulfide reductase subunit C